MCPFKPFKGNRLYPLWILVGSAVVFICGISLFALLDIQEGSKFGNLLPLHKHVIKHESFVPSVDFPPEFLYIPQKLHEHTGPMTPNKMEIENFVFVTGIDRHHFKESMDMVASVQATMTGYRLILYDLGLLESQVNQIQTWCQVEYRRFNFQKYPPHVKNLKTYAFKPLIVQEMLQEFSAILWMDASIRLTCSLNDTLAQLYNTVTTTRGLAFSVREELLEFQVVHPKMLTYLPTNQSKLRQTTGIGAGHMYFLKNEMTLTLILFPWIACALTKDCIAPEGAVLQCRKNILVAGICHRFEQAALSILLFNVFNFNVTKFMMPADCVMVRRKPTEMYKLIFC